MEKFVMLFEEYLIEKEKWAQDVNVEKGKMKSLLGLKPDEKVTDKYSSGEQLAKDLVKALNGDQKKAAGMLAFAANVDKTNNVLDSALKYLKNM